MIKIAGRARRHTTFPRRFMSSRSPGTKPRSPGLWMMSNISARLPAHPLACTDSRKTHKFPFPRDNGSKLCIHVPRSRYIPRWPMYFILNTAIQPPHANDPTWGTAGPYPGIDEFLYQKWWSLYLKRRNLYLKRGILHWKWWIAVSSRACHWLGANLSACAEVINSQSGEIQLSAHFWNTTFPRLNARFDPILDPILGLELYNLTKSGPHMQVRSD